MATADEPPEEPDYEGLARRFMSHSLAEWHDETLSGRLYKLENAIQEGAPPKEIRDQYFAMLAKWGEYLSYFSPAIAALGHLDDDSLHIIEGGYENLQWLAHYARSTTPESDIDEQTAYHDAKQALEQTLEWLEEHEPEDSDGD